MDLVASFFSAPPASGDLWLRIGLTFLVTIVALVALSQAPTRARRPVVATVTFVAGLFYVLLYLWPQPFDRKPNDLPLNAVEGVGFWLKDAQPVISTFANIIAGTMLGLGIFSLLSIHVRRFVKKQRDWQFSGLLLLSMLCMVTAGYWNWNQRLGPAGNDLQLIENWGFPQYAYDFMFDGMLQQMDAAMFSIIAFFILSAAYRAFRVRSVEATILLSAALIMMLSLMGAVEFQTSEAIRNVTGGDPNHFLANFTLKEISSWMRSNLQNPSLRAVDFGVGVGALAMGLRLWLSLERGGVSV